MKNREMIFDCLYKIHYRYSSLKDAIEDMPDESFDDILDNRFREFAQNIETNFAFLEMIITRSIPLEESFDESEFEMTNEELEDYFTKHWSSVKSVCI